MAPTLSQKCVKGMGHPPVLWLDVKKTQVSFANLGHPVSWLNEKLRVPRLRYASLGMTTLFCGDCTGHMRVRDV